MRKDWAVPLCQWVRGNVRLQWRTAQLWCLVPTLLQPDLSCRSQLTFSSKQNVQNIIKLGGARWVPHIFPAVYPLAGGHDPAACLGFPSGRLVPTCLVSPLLLIFFIKGEITACFLGLWAMFSPASGCWRKVASKLRAFLRKAFLSAWWAVALLPSSVGPGQLR